MIPGKWKVNLNHRIFMLYKSAETCHPVSLTCKGTNIQIFVTCGASFYLRVWSVQPPIQSLYPWVRCIYMQECSVHLLICLLFPWVQQISTFKNVFNTRWYHFYSHVCDVFTCKNVLYTRSVRLLFPRVQCHSLKPALSQCSQNVFVAVDDFIALYTPSYVFYSHGCNKFLHSRTIFTLADTIAPIFTMLTDVWPRANRAMVANNWTVLTEVRANRNRVNWGFPVL